MLHSLSIENILLVKNANLTFCEGLCVLTGETGVGKSIIMNSILILLGKEIKSKSLVRQGYKYGSIEGVFINSQEVCEKILIEHAITPSSEIKIKCIIQENNKIMYFINNHQVSQNIIAQLGENLAEINRQHEQTFLMEEKNHLTILDAYSQNEGELIQIAEIYRHIQLCENEIQEITRKNKEIAFEMEHLNNTKAELQNADLFEGEYEELQEKRIENKKKQNIFETLTSASSKLEGISIGQVLMNIRRMISPIANDDMENISQTIERICTDSEDIQHKITSLIEKNYISIAEIDKNEERYFFLQDLSRKYKVQPFELHRLLLETERKITNFNKTAESITELKAKKQTIENQYHQIAQTLRHKRTEAGKKLENKINGYLDSLEMHGASFSVNISEDKIRKNGMDSVIFMIETNKNMGFGKLATIASGGEVSRIVLAIKVAIAHLKHTSCVIFDEIDTGISGKTSNAVGEVMLQLSQNVQIIVITHQPQVASKAHGHFCIKKEQINGETETKVEMLEYDSRVQEIARLLSGKNISDEAILNAKSLLQSSPLYANKIFSDR